MKKILLMFLVFGNLAVWAGEIDVKVNGMVCSMCAQGIQKKFKNEPAVRHVVVDMDLKIVMIHTQMNQDISDETITKLITEAGYNVASIKRK